MTYILCFPIVNISTALQKFNPFSVYKVCNHLLRNTLEERMEKKTYNKKMFRWTISRDRPEKACLSRPWRCKAESVGTSLQPSFNAKMTMNIKINSVGIFELASWLNVSPRAIGPWLPNKYLLLLFTVSIECWIFCLFKMPLTFILSHHLNQAACLWQCGHHETNTLSPIDI